MTIEELCSNNADYLEGLSDKELYNILEPFLKFTRPDKVDKKANEKLSAKKSSVTGGLSDEVKNLARQMGLDLEDL